MKAIFAAILAILFIFQYHFNNTPKIAIYHANDGTECTCRCIDSAENNSQCGLVADTAPCECDQAHIPVLQFSSTQLSDVFIVHGNEFTCPEHFDYLITRNFVISITNLPSILDHPPQV